MLTRAVVGCALAAFMVVDQGQAASPPPDISPDISPAILNVQQLVVVPGPNVIAHLAPDGRDGLIVEGSHSDSPIADGLSIDYMVLLKAANPDRGWEAVDVESTPALASDAPFGGVLARAIPHTGEDWKRSLVFAHAVVNGSRETVLLMAERDMSKAETAYTPAPVRISAFALRAEPDTGQDHFVLIRQSWAPKCYVDAEWALIEAFKLSTPVDDQGDRGATACKAPRS